MHSGAVRCTTDSSTAHQSRTAVPLLRLWLNPGPRRQRERPLPLPAVQPPGSSRNSPGSHASDAAAHRTRGSSGSASARGSRSAGRTRVNTSARNPTVWDGRFANNGWLQELPLFANRPIPHAADPGEINSSPPCAPAAAGAGALRSLPPVRWAARRRQSSGPVRLEPPAAGSGRPTGVAGPPSAIDVPLTILVRRTAPDASKFLNGCPSLARIVHGPPAKPRPVVPQDGRAAAIRGCDGKRGEHFRCASTLVRRCDERLRERDRSRRWNNAQLVERIFQWQRYAVSSV